MGSSATSAGKSMTRNLTAPLMAIGTASMYTAVKFDDAMRSVKAKTGATGEEFEALRDQARQLGRDTRYSASEAAAGMDYLAMAGFETNEIMATMPDMLNLASAANTDLGTTANIASNILTGFGMDATEMGHAADVMALACASSNTDLTQLGEAMSYAAPVAKGFGMSIEETAAAVGFLSNAGIQSSMAGTTLRGMLTKLSDPTDEATKKLASYGIALEDVNPEVNSFTDILKVLKDAGVSTADMMALMGQRAGPGAAALLAQGYENLETYTEELENSDGAAERMAETMEEGPGGALRKMKSALESVSITLGDVISEALLPFIDMISSGASKLSQFGEDHPGILKIGVAIGAAVAIIGPLLAGFGLIITAVGSISAGPLLAVAAAAGLIYTAIKTVMNGDAMEKLKSIDFSAMFENIKQTFSNIAARVMPILETFSEFALNQFVKITEWWGENGDTITDAIQLIAGILLDVFETVFPYILSILEGSLSIMMDTITFFAQLLTGDWSGAWDSLKDIFSSAWGILTDVVVGALDGLATLLYDAGAALLGAFSDGIVSMAGPLGDTVEGVLGGIGDYFPHSPAKKGPFHVLPNWGAVFEGIGEVDAETPTKQAVSGMSATIGGTAPSAMAANAAAGGGIGGNTYGGDTYEIKIGTVQNQADIDYLMSEIEKRNRSNRLRRGIGL